MAYASINPYNGEVLKTFPVASDTENRPSISVEVPPLPAILTETPAKGSFFSFKTLPVSFIDCAWANEKIPIQEIIDKINKNVVIS